jgi:hypothetical protein
VILTIAEASTKLCPFMRQEGEYMVIMRLTEAKAKGRCGFAMGEVTVEQQ